MEQPLPSVRRHDVEFLRSAREAMGTRFEVLIRLAGPAGSVGPVGRANRLACAEAALDEIEDLHRRLSLFRRDSVLSYMNANAAAGAVRIDPELFGLLAACRAVHARSSGAFDPSVGPLMESFGFRGGKGCAPDEEALAAARASVGFDAVVLDEEAYSVRFRKPGLSLDLGGVAKGFGLDQAARILRNEGVTDALIHGGTSTVLALGAEPRESRGRRSAANGWTIGIRDPRGAGSKADDAPARPRLLAKARLCNAALSVSAPHGRSFEADGRVRGHLMNPATGAPAEGALLAAVVSASATLADAWSTAFLAAGPERFDGLVGRADGIDAALLLHGPAGRERLTVRGSHPEIFEISTARPGCRPAIPDIQTTLKE